MDKQYVKYKYSGILFSLKRKETDTSYSTDALEDIMLSEIRPSQEDKYWTMPLI